MANCNHLILGSSSPFRKELLERLGLDFTCQSPEIDETPLKGETPAQLAGRLSVLKARAIAKNNPGCVVIGSDQVLDLDGKCLGKPLTHEKAIQQLTDMSGKTVTFHSAMCVIDAQGNEQTADITTELVIRELSPEAIEAYLQHEKPYRCAGSAKIEKMGIAIIREFRSSDPTAIIGLPLIRLTEMLSKAGIDVLPGLIHE